MQRIRSRCSSGCIVSASWSAAAHWSASYGLTTSASASSRDAPGELRQDQHALLVVARGDELLGDEVHAVVQAADEAQVGGAVILVDGLGLVVLDDEHDRRIARRRAKRALISSASARTRSA